MNRPTITHPMEPQPRAIRPPSSRRALFNSTSHNPSTHAPTRRTNPTSVRPDTANIFAQPMEDELVERDPKGDYILNAPHPSYKHLALGLEQEVDAETESEKQIIDLYGKQNAHWDAAAVVEEIKAALKNSLKRNVASIEEDKWMFEGDKEGMGKN